MGILLNMVILLLSQVLLACEAMVTYLSPFVRGFDYILSDSNEIVLQI